MIYKNKIIVLYEVIIKNSKLKSCPFCGAEARIELKECSSGHENHDDWKIYCTNCRAVMYIAADNYYGRDYYTYDEAIAQWNKRV